MAQKNMFFKKNVDFHDTFNLISKRMQFLYNTQY